MENPHDGPPPFNADASNVQCNSSDTPHDIGQNIGRWSNVRMPGQQSSNPATPTRHHNGTPISNNTPSTTQDRHYDPWMDVDPPESKTKKGMSWYDYASKNKDILFGQGNGMGSNHNPNNSTPVIPPSGNSKHTGNSGIGGTPQNGTNGGNPGGNSGGPSGGFPGNNGGHSGGPPSGGSSGPNGGGGGGGFDPYGQNQNNFQVQVFKPIEKPTVKAYPVLKEIEKYDKWYQDLLTTSRSHGTDDVLKEQYRPDSYNAFARFEQVQKFMYAVFRYTVRPTELEEYVQDEIMTGDAQQAIANIKQHMRHSTYAILSSQTTMQDIITTRFQPGKEKAYDFILRFNELFRAYNRQQRRPELRISPFHKRSYLQTALSPARDFKSIADRETDRLAMGGAEFTYLEYLTAAKAVASRYDKGGPPRRTRDINNVINEREDDSDEDTVTETQINEVRRKTRDPKNFAAQMNKETWGSLSKDTQKTWDEISKEDKAKILQYSMDREAKRKTLIKANMHLTDTISENEDAANEGDDEASVEDGNAQISVNNAIQRARNDAHIGDPRRVLGSDKATEIKAMMHRFVHDDYGEESESDNESDFLWGGR